MIKDMIIKDLKQMIHRLQDECTEKTTKFLILADKLLEEKNKNDKLIKTQERISSLIRSTSEYRLVCLSCGDEAKLIKADYTQEDVEYMALLNIINSLDKFKESNKDEQK